MIKFYSLLLVFLFQFSFVSKIAAQNPRPNFLIICTDDLIKNSISIYDSLSILQTPNINRIGEEGLNVTKYYSTNSLCIPGRATMLSGKYGHETGACNNSTYLANSIETFPKDLHNNGYYTALCGKWMVGNSTPKPEFDYWLWTPGKTSYIDDTCKYFDSTFVAYGHITDMLTDSVLRLISIVDTPFMILLNHNAPHGPYIPQPQFNGLFDTLSLQVPINYPAYYKNYPSAVYEDSAFYITGLNQFQNLNRAYLELMAGVEESTGKILDSLQALGLLENTMVVFTTDNGYMIGPHQLKGKEYPYEETISMPMLIRYPPWFNAGSTIDNSFVLNTDFAPTILDAAGIQPLTQMEGNSINSIFNNQFSRSEFMYEVIPPAASGIMQVRAVRTNEFQYNRYYCVDTTEELFDMINDPFQITNLVNDCNYQTILNQYRIKLDSLRITLNDTVAIADTCDCYLVNPVYSCCIAYNVDVSETICSTENYFFNNTYLIMAGNYSDTLIDIFGCDSVVTLHLMVLVPANDSINQTICSGDNYIFNGTALNTSGNYSATYSAMSGCDSTVFLNLEVLTPNNNFYSEQICFDEAYTFNGVVLDSTGNYSAIHVAANGCDSVEFLQLIEFAPISTLLNYSICSGQTFNFNGNTLSSTGIYTENLISNFGCDSTVTLNLIVDSIIFETLLINICQGDDYFFNGTNYTLSGTYYDTLTAAAGCDSICILNLSVHVPVSNSVLAIICAGNNFNFNGTLLNLSGNYIDTLISATNCDSIVYLQLSVLDPFSGTETIAICSGDTYNFNGNFLDSSGIYFTTITAANGCDSVIQLTLFEYAEINTVISDTICQWETYNFNNTLISTPGTYDTILLSATNCDSSITLYLTKIYTQAGISQSGDTLSTPGIGAIQWMNCNTDTLIPGATAITFIPLFTGNYAAIITNGNCVDTTNCRHVTITGLDELHEDELMFDVYPNPTDERVSIRLSQQCDNCTLEISNTLGQIIYTEWIKNKSTFIHLKLFPSGIYFISIHSEKMNGVRKLVVD